MLQSCHLGVSFQTRKLTTPPPATPACVPRGRQLVRTQQNRLKQAVRAQQSLDYKQAGVDIDAGAELVKRIQKLNPSIGGFSGLVPFGEE